MWGPDRKGCCGHRGGGEGVDCVWGGWVVPSEPTNTMATSGDHAVSDVGGAECDDGASAPDEECPMTGVETAGSAHPWGDDGEGSDPDSHADLDGDDAIIVTQNEEGDATPASPDPHVTQAPTTPAAVDDDVIVSSEPGAKRYPDKGARLLVVMYDVEFSHPIKAIGEIFQLAARPFRVEVVGTAPRYNDSKVEDINELLFAEWVQPSLEFGKNEFFHAVIEVRQLQLHGPKARHMACVTPAPADRPCLDASSACPLTKRVVGHCVNKRAGNPPYCALTSHRSCMCADHRQAAQ